MIRDLFGPRSTRVAFEAAFNVMFDFGRGLGSAGEIRITWPKKFQYLTTFSDLKDFVSGPHAVSPLRNVAECQIGFQAHFINTGWGKVDSSASFGT